MSTTEDAVQSDESAAPATNASGPVIDFRVRMPRHLRPVMESPRENTERYDAVLSVLATRSATLDDLIAEMDALGVTHAVMHAEYEYGDPVDDLNAALARVVADGEGRFSGFGTVSLAPLSVSRALEQVDQVFETGLRGLNIQPAFFGMAPTAAKLYPVYARAEQLGLPVALHTGVNYTTHMVIENDHPRYLDQLACDFPNLVIVACHAAWPWANELVAMMRKHGNLYAEFGGLAPKYVAEPDTGWGVMHRFMDSLLSGQVLFATDWPVFSQRRALEEWHAIPLKEQSRRSLLGENAATLLGHAGQRTATPPAEPPSTVDLDRRGQRTM
jgi:predicted TIM-barrel fold metal-dependent hydrolase